MLHDIGTICGLMMFGAALITIGIFIGFWLGGFVEYLQNV
jgi:hypothetical protein